MCHSPSEISTHFFSCKKKGVVTARLERGRGYALETRELCSIPGSRRDFPLFYNIHTGTGSSCLMPSECWNFFLEGKRPRDIATHLHVVKHLYAWRYSSKSSYVVNKNNYNLNFSGIEYPVPILNKRLWVILKQYFASWGNNMPFSVFKLKEMPNKCVLLYRALFCFCCCCWRTRSRL